MATPFPPFEPAGRNKRRRFRRLRRVPLRVILPSAVTVLAICAGLTAIRMGYEGRYGWAIAAIGLAAFFDALDGRLARFLRSSSAFGAELDSLADFVNFGVAPALVLFFWDLHEIRTFGWIVVLVFSIAVALRLARFNVALTADDAPRWHADFFIGIPAPAAALTVMLPIYFDFVGLNSLPGATWWTALYALLIGLLTISWVPTFSGKRVGARIDRNFVAPLFVLMAVLIALAVSFPWHVAVLTVCLYLASLPISRAAYERRQLKDSKKTAPSRDDGKP